jgi:protein tyrosine phosphatase
MMMPYINSLFENVNMIIPENSQSGSLWLGNYKSALDPVFLKDNKISVIINCSADLPYIYDILDPANHGLNKLETFRIPVYDSLLDHDIYIMEQYYHTVLPFILKKLLTERKNVLVHCHAGAQRSASVVAAVLFVLIDNDIMTFDKLPNRPDKSKLMKKIIAYILEKRTRAFSYGFRVNFKKSLENFFNLTF